MSTKKVLPVISSRPREQQVARYMDEVKAMQEAGLDRRDLLKMGLTAGVGGLVSIGGGRSFLPNLAHAASGSGSGFPGAMISPPATSPWTDPLPIPKACKPAKPCGLTGAYNKNDASQEWQPGDMIGPVPGKSPCQNLVDLPHDYCGSKYGKVNDRTVIPAAGFQDARALALGLPNPEDSSGKPQDPLYSSSFIDQHQRWDEILSGVGSGYKLIEPSSPYYANPQSNTVYELCTREIKWNFYSDTGFSPGRSSVWTFFDMHSDAAGVLRVNAQYGQPVVVRQYNMMGDNAGVCGISQQSTHLHNGHTPSESDGGPMRFFDAGYFRDYWYPNIRAGFASSHKNGTSYNGRWCPGDYRETMSTLWFHDHRMDFTSQNVYKGLASFYTLSSDDILLDTGNEATGLRLPSGDFDIPMLFTDKSFYQDGEMFFDLNDKRGMVGDMITVNFKIKPRLDAKRRRYRFRLLDAGPSRFYQFCITDNNGKKLPVLQITDDGNLLPRALTVTDIRLGVAERVDIIVDLSDEYLRSQGFDPLTTTTLWLHDPLIMTTPQGQSGSLMPLGEKTKVLKINRGDPAPDSSNTIAALAAMNPLLPLPLLPGESATVSRSTAIAGMLKDKRIKNRTFSFGTLLDQWVVNDKLFDPSVISAYPIADSGEIWTWTGGNGWSHPVHHHLEESQELSRKPGSPGAGIPADEVARKDVYRIGDGAVGTSGLGTQFYLRFRDWTGDYPIHCHNVVHEDHAMMFRINVVPKTHPKAGT